MVEELTKKIYDYLSEVRVCSLSEIRNFLIHSDSENFSNHAISLALASLIEIDFVDRVGDEFGITFTDLFGRFHVPANLSENNLRLQLELEQELVAIDRGNQSVKGSRGIASPNLDAVARSDVSKIDIESTTLSLQSLIDRLEYDQIALDPDYHRNADAWGVRAQSRLIESILIRFPLPTFYFDVSDDQHWVIVDGLQRMAAIRNFVVDQSLRLQELEFLDQATFDGKTFAELAKDFQRRIR